MRRQNRRAPHRLLPGLLALAVTAAAFAPAAGARERPPARAVHVITVDDAITGATAEYIQDAIDRTAAEDGECLVVRLDTPGGLLEATRDIVQALLNTRVPVVVYIAPSGARGASAGTMITMASHVAAMAPATHIGAAHPVSIFGGGEDKVMAEKVVNDTSAFIEAIAELRGRNAEWAISAVRESKSITASRALELNVVDVIADDLHSLLEKIDGREIHLDRTTTTTLETAGKAVVQQDMSFSQSFLSFISNPNLVYILMIVGLVGLYIELSNPGLIVPGVVGGICLLLALIAMQTLPIQYGAFGLILLGIALLVAESFVPSFGILGIGGLISIVIGSIFLLDPAITDLHVSLPVILSASLSVGLVALLIGRLLLKSFRLRPRSFADSMAGREGEVRVAIAPGRPGKVFINGELWKASAQEEISAGTPVVVQATHGLELEVAPREAGPAAEAQAKP